MLAAPAVQGQGVFHRNALSALTEQLGMTDYNELAGILKNTIMPKASDEEMAAFALVCSTYKLNPLTREVYAFPTKAGGIMPMIGIDGWLKIAHSHPDYAGMGWAEGAEDNDRWCECTVWLKSTPEHPVTIREYLSECRQASSPVWAQRPKRMLRHRATIQAIRYALGISGVSDADDYEEQGFGGSMQLRDVTRMPEGVKGCGGIRPAVPVLPVTGVVPGKGAPETGAVSADDEAEGLAELKPAGGGLLHPELHGDKTPDLNWPEGM